MSFLRSIRLLHTTQRGRRGLLLAALAVIMLIAGVLATDWFTRAAVTLEIEDDTQRESVRFYTHADTVSALLAEAEIDLDPEDRVQPDRATTLHDGMVIRVMRAAHVAVLVDGALYRIRTQAAHPLAILDTAGITVQPGDVIQVDGRDYALTALRAQDWNAAPSNIAVKRSVTVQIIDEGQPASLRTTARDVSGVLAAIDGTGRALYLADTVQPAYAAPVEDGLSIHIERALPVTVIADGQRLDTRAHGPTVGDALAMIGVAPIGQDFTVPPLESPLVPGMVIRLTRVPATAADQDPGTTHE